MTTERAAVARPQLKGQHTPGESSEMAFSFPCFLFDVTKSFLFLNLSQVGRSQASDLAKQGVSGEFACSENPEVWGWRRGDWRQWCGECAGDTCLCVSSGPWPRPAPPPCPSPQAARTCACAAAAPALATCAAPWRGQRASQSSPATAWSPGHPAQLQLQPTRRHQLQVPLGLGTWPPPRPAAAVGRPGQHGTLLSNPASPTLAPGPPLVPKVEGR